jgi:Armadillo/beta-catenin-like repeat
MRVGAFSNFYMQDDNRKLVAESGVIPTIVEGLSSKDPSLVRTACGALMNLCIDSGNARNMFRKKHGEM